MRHGGCRVAALPLQEPPSEDNNGADFLLTDDGEDTDLRLARLESLTKRRPELLSSVMLRQASTPTEEDAGGGVY
jgi:hypothetical protein